MKWVTIVFLMGLLFSCSLLGYDRLYKIKFVNQSGFVVKKAMLYFSYESGYVIDKVEVKSLADGEAIEVLYNLEHLEGFLETSGKVSVEFMQPNNGTLKKDLSIIELRRTSVDYTINIKSDTLLLEWFRK